MSIYNLRLYICPCGYYTPIPGNANRHKKSTCKHAEHMKSEDSDFIKKTDNNSHGTVTQTAVSSGGIVNNSAQHANVINQNTVIFNMPQNTLKEDMLLYLEKIKMINEPGTSFIVQMPGELLDRTRNAQKFPGALTERGDKIIEKLPGGGERVMGRKKAIKVFTHEAVNAICNKPPTRGTAEYFEKERQIGKKEMTIREAVEASATNSVDFHHKTPSELKKVVGRIEDHTASVLNKITKDNYQTSTIPDF